MIRINSVAFIKEMISEEQKHMNWYSRTSRCGKRMNKLSAKEDKILVGLKQGP